MGAARVVDLGVGMGARVGVGVEPGSDGWEVAYRRTLDPCYCNEREGKAR